MKRGFEVKPVWLVIFLAALVFGFGISRMMAVRRGRPVYKTTTYGGVLTDVMLPSKGGFVTDLTEYSAPNITDHELKATYRTVIALNGTKADGRDYHTSLVFDIDGAVKDFKISEELVNEDQLQAKDDLTITTAEWWTHEDNPTMKTDIDEKGTIEEGYNLKEYSLGKVTGGEYVFKNILHSATIEPNAATGDTIGYIKGDIVRGTYKSCIRNCPTGVKPTKTGTPSIGDDEANSFTIELQSS